MPSIKPSSYSENDVQISNMVALVRTLRPQTGVFYAAGCERCSFKLAVDNVAARIVAAFEIRVIRKLANISVEQASLH